jgi:choline dehydrogenase-like flavoprotein
MTRSTARKGYYDPVYQTRSNLKLLTSRTVSKILFDNLTATGVEATSGGESFDFHARKEVILAAGAVQTAHLLQISGIGPKEVLQAARVPVKKDMAAVGANFQDHATIQMVYNLSHLTFPNYDSLDLNATYNATAFEEYFTSRTGPVAAGSGSTSISFSLPQMTNSSTSIAKALVSQTAQQYLPEIYGDTQLLAGFKAQREILAKRYADNVSAVVFGAVTGTGFSFMPFLKPLSRGTVTLNASDPQGLPVVQYNTLMNPVDIDVLVAAIKHRRRLWSSPALDIFEPVETIPGLQYQSDDEIAEALRSFTNPGLAHESCSCPMMPEHLGGCVGPDLKVYGIDGLSIVDASVFPLIPGVSLQGTVYAVAEKAADLIKARASL